MRVLEPLFAEMEELGEGLEFEDFAGAMENLMEGLDPTEKALVLDVGKKQEPQQKLTFRVPLTQPVTNSSVREVHRPGVSLYERSLENRRVREI